jgi:16S rRNA processing protein RimM
VLRHSGREQTLDVEESAPSFPNLVMKFRGFDSPEAVKALNGAELISGRDHASPLGPAEYYVEDLRGMAVNAADGENLGHITDIIEGGGGDLAEIRLLTGGELKLVPFRSEFFGEIHPEKGFLTLLQRWILE